jgi:DNA topoisomerase-1
MLCECKRNDKGQVYRVVGQPSVPEHIKRLKIPPAWTGVQVANDPADKTYAIGFDAAGRLQRLYSPEHVASAKDAKFGRVRQLMVECDDIRSQIELDIKSNRLNAKWREAAVCLYLIVETGMRPSSSANTGAVPTYGASTIELRHIKVMSSGRVRLQYIGKKGVARNVLVTNPWLVEELTRRKQSSKQWSKPVFAVSSSTVNAYAKRFGYTAKDFRTLRGTMLAKELLDRHIPRTKAKAKKALNAALDQVAKSLGNTRAVARSAYVDPAFLEPWNKAIAPKPKA